jgi:hypothetical protein
VILSAIHEQRVYALVVIVALFGLTQFVGGPQGLLTSSALVAQGDDVATRAENQARPGWSIAGGLWGYLDLKVNLRLAQTATHVFRAHLLEPLYRLPMTVLDDSRIGGAIYRVMYDTASLPSICFKERARFDADSRDSFSNYRRVYLARLLTLAVSVMTGIAIALYAWVLTSDKAIEGRFTPGDYWVVPGMYTTIAATLGGFARVWFDLQDNIAGVRRVLFFFDMPGEDSRASRAPLPPVRDNVTTEDADVVYPDGRQALHGASFTARVGEVVAVVGPTGAGKTSLAYLIPAFLQRRGVV